MMVLTFLNNLLPLLLIRLASFYNSQNLLGLCAHR
jgi:hypothetical protein